MDDPSTYGIVGRLAIAAFVIIAPTILFLGLVRGLERLRDDDLINEWARNRGSGDEIPPNDDVLAVLASGLEFERAGASSVHCPACGVANRTSMRYCRECLTRLPS
ncbi:DUF7577 domain-containing protein [Natronococcus wangiae]|uniref:DUF7577 domain-containing protein n=1 Tax=Natronococcus wangiae TaxID=3068275 RepID=UPI00273F7A34|nr:zinc ribbon domain-containing protein [Natronococcus sp. AD5]